MSTARVPGMLKLVLCIAFYFALATVALTDPKKDPGDDDDKRSAGELTKLHKKNGTVRSDASQTAKANANAKVKPVQPLVKTTASTVSVNAQQKLPAKTSQEVQESKVNKTRSKKRSGG